MAATEGQAGTQPKLGGKIQPVMMKVIIARPALRRLE
jgi:hypothetical protein